MGGKFHFDSGIDIEDALDNFTIVQDGKCTLALQLEATYNRGAITLRDWNYTNKYRVFLNVLTVADIINGDGSTISDGTFLRSFKQIGHRLYHGQYREDSSHCIGLCIGEYLNGILPCMVRLLHNYYVHGWLVVTLAIKKSGSGVAFT